MSIKYKLKEVEVHNKDGDAWIIINRNVYNVSSWIGFHPGGDVILEGLGKDASDLFKSGGHGDYELEFLEKFKIGEVI